MTESSQTANQTANQEAPLIFTVENNIAFITLNRPKQYNALSKALLDGLLQAFDRIQADQTIRVAVIAANGKAFCAGHDLKEMREAHDQAFVEALFAKCSAMMMAIANLPIPVIAEVQGMATAAGCQLVAQCDLAITSEHAKFAVSGINLGLFCSTPAVPLSRAISKKRAAEMLMTGEFIDAATALNWGLVNRVAADETLRAVTLQLCEVLKSKPREALATGKALLYRQLEVGLTAAYADASNTIACNFITPYAQEGVSAFLEKRKPDWTAT